MACFRVAQEALTNMLRHARARAIWVSLHCLDEGLSLLIRDDGVAFDVPRVYAEAVVRSHLGLLGMRERAQLVGGRGEVLSSAEHGTEVRAWFPLSNSREMSQNLELSVAMNSGGQLTEQ